MVSYKITALGFPTQRGHFIQTLLLLGRESGVKRADVLGQLFNARTADVDGCYAGMVCQPIESDRSGRQPSFQGLLNADCV